MGKISLTRAEKIKYLSQDPKVSDVINSMTARQRLPNSKAISKQIDTVVALARKFNEEVVKPVYKQIDLDVSKDNDYLCHDFIKKANERGLYTLFIAKMFGGSGYNLIGMYPFIEELASVCVGLANVVGVHYLGYATLCSSWNLKLINEICRDVKRGEKTGVPTLISLTITEPGAGTDLEETELIDKARVGTIAQKVEGGYIVNGNKIFISNGHVSTWHMLIAYADKTHPSKSTIMMAVKNGMKGFSFGHHEKKMGQKACVASELIFEDCFIPDNYICFDSTFFPENASKSPVEIVQNCIDYVVSSTRAGVGAFAVGAARGAYETALSYARKKMVNGTLLINHQWAQSMLAEMYKNVNTGRAIYMESAYANTMHGLAKTLFFSPIYYADLFLPSWYWTFIASPFLNLKIMTKLFRWVNFYQYPQESAEIQSGWASLTKFGCTDLGIINSQMALQLMGIDGCRHDIGSEKYYRDAKLLQIYEGTNQLNRINLFKNLVGRGMSEVKVF